MRCHTLAAALGIAALFSRTTLAADVNTLMTYHGVQTRSNPAEAPADDGRTLFTVRPSDRPRIVSPRPIGPTIEPAENVAWQRQQRLIRLLIALEQHRGR